MTRYVEVTARWETTETLEVPDDSELVKRVIDGDLDALVEAGDVTSNGAELVDWTAKEVRTA